MLLPRHIEAYMDGVPLSSISPVLLNGVYEDAPELELTEGDRPGRYGYRLLGKKRQTLKVSLQMVIRELHNLPARSQALEAIAHWCQGEVLELSNHPGRFLAVSCTSEPSLLDDRDFTSRIRAEFTAYQVPYWQDKRLSASALESGLTGSANIRIPGTVPSPVMLSVVPSAALTSFSVTVAGQTIALTGLTVPANGELVFARDALDNLAVTLNDVSQLSHRSDVSADDLMADPGYAAVSYTADAACTVTVKTRGRWA